MFCWLQYLKQRIKHQTVRIQSFRFLLTLKNDKVMDFCAITRVQMMKITVALQPYQILIFSIVLSTLLFESNSFSSQSYIRFCPRGISYLSCPPCGRDSRGIWSIILTSCTLDMFLLFCIFVLFRTISIWSMEELPRIYLTQNRATST